MFGGDVGSHVKHAAVNAEVVEVSVDGDERVAQRMEVAGLGAKEKAAKASLVIGYGQTS